MSIAWIGGRPGWGEVVVVIAVLVLLFGARKIPELARSLGKSLGEFKKGREEGAKENKPGTPADTDESKPKPAP